MPVINVGDSIKCKVTGIEKYGIFVSVDNNYTGLIHISEISEDFVKDINEYAQIGDTIFAKVIALDEEEKKLKLSIKNIDYRNTGLEISKIDGFSGLRKQLPIWIEEYNNSSNKPTSK